MEQKTSPVLLFKLLMEQMWHFLQVLINLPCILMIIVFWHGPKRDINDDIFIASSYRNFPDYVNQSTQLVSEFLIKLTFMECRLSMSVQSRKIIIMIDILFLTRIKFPRIWVEDDDTTKFSPGEVFKAISDNDMKYLEKLIKEGYPVNFRDVHMMTPLHRACSR